MTPADATNPAGPGRIRRRGIGAVRLGLAGMAAGLLTGCSLTPAYQSPAQPLPATLADAAPSSSSDADLPEPARWWASFNSPELVRLLADAQADNLDLRAATARIAEARAAARVAAAPLTPTAGYGASLVETRGGSLGDYRLSNSSADLLPEIDYSLDLFGRLHAQARSAASLATASRWDGEAARLSIAAAVADAYFFYLSLEDRLALARASARDAQAFLQVIQERRGVGSATEVDLDQQRTVLSGLNGNGVALAQQLAEARRALAVLVGRPAIAPAATGLAGVAQPAVAADLPSTLVARRPDVRAAEARLRAANFDIGAARAAFFPTIALSGQTGLESGSLARLLHPATAVSGTLSVVGPLLDGALAAQVRLNRARYEELAADYRQTILTGFRDAADALAANARLAELERENAAAAAASRHALDLARLRYRTGTVDLLTVLAAQRSANDAADLLVQVRLRRLQAGVALFAALAGGYGPVPAPSA